MSRSILVVPLALPLVAATLEVPGYTVEKTPTSTTIASTTPGTFRITASVGPHPGELVLSVDAQSDGDLEFASSVDRRFNDGLAGAYRNSCVSPAFVPEFESVRLYDPTTFPIPEGALPFVLFEHYDDGNVHIVLDADLDGHADAETTTDFVLEPPERAKFCRKAMKKRPGLPRPT